MESDIDVVYTWVNGADLKFQDRLQKYLPKTSTSPDQAITGSKRFRDNDELRYSLRSLETYAPWFHKVYIVTNGQIPEWLDTSNNRVSIVTDDMIFPNKSDLPTFNSTANEINLHRIPNLSKKFLYLCDDYFFGRATSKNDFLTPEGQIIYFQQIQLHSNMNEGLVHDRAYAYTQNLVEKLWSKSQPRLLPAHSPQLYDRDIITHLEQMIPDEFREASSHKFRAGNDLSLKVLYSFFMLEHPEQRDLNEAKILKDFSHDYSFVSLGGRPLRMLYFFWKIKILRPKFFCINDDLGDVPANHKILLYLRKFLRSYFPHPSSFELSK